MSGNITKPENITQNRVVKFLQEPLLGIDIQQILLARTFSLHANKRFNMSTGIIVLSTAQVG